MCAAVLWLLCSLCVCCTALSPEKSGVMWGELGGSVTIQCRHSDPDQWFLYLLGGLNKDVNVLIKMKQSTSKIKNEFKNRIEVKGDVPSMDILITNLTVEDTGVYWCVFKKFKDTLEKTNGNGSVLLVVTGAAQECDPPTTMIKYSGDLVLILLVIAAVVLLIFCIVFIIWFKRKVSRSTKKPRRAPTNDVYEDMRATIRR